MATARAYVYSCKNVTCIIVTPNTWVLYFTQYTTIAQTFHTKPSAITFTGLTSHNLAILILVFYIYSTISVTLNVYWFYQHVITTSTFCFSYHHILLLTLLILIIIVMWTSKLMIEITGSVLFYSITFVCINTMPLLFADDTNLFASRTNIIQLQDAVTNVLNSIAEWLKVNRLSLNIKKTHFIIFPRENSPNLM